MENQNQISHPAVNGKHWSPKETSYFRAGFANPQIQQLTGRTAWAVAAKRAELVQEGKLPKRYLNIRMRADGSTTLQGNPNAFTEALNKMSNTMENEQLIFTPEAAINTIEKNIPMATKRSYKPRVSNKLNSKGNRRGMHMKTKSAIPTVIQPTTNDLNLIIGGVNLTIKHAKHVTIDNNNVKVDY